MPPPTTTTVDTLFNTEESIERLAAFMGRLTSIAPKESAVILIMPDRAKDGSKRGSPANDDHVIDPIQNRSSKGVRQSLTV